MILYRTEHAGRIAGALVSVNTACGIMGSLCAGFLLLLIVGLQKSILLVWRFAVVCGIVELSIHFDQRKRVYRIWFAVVLCFFATIVLRYQTSVTRDFLAAEGELIDYKEGYPGDVMTYNNLGYCSHRRADMMRLYHVLKRPFHSSPAMLMPLQLL